MHEGVAGLSRPVGEREATVAEGKLVAEFDQLAARVVGGIGSEHAVVKMDFRFAPAGAAVVGEHFD